MPLRKGYKKVSTEEMSTEVMSKEEMSKEEMSKEEMSKEEMSKEEMSKEEVSKEESRTPSPNMEKVDPKRKKKRGGKKIVVEVEGLADAIENDDSENGCVTRDDSQGKDVSIPSNDLSRADSPKTRKKKQKQKKKESDKTVKESKNEDMIGGEEKKLSEIHGGRPVNNFKLLDFIIVTVVIVAAALFVLSLGLKNNSAPALRPPISASPTIYSSAAPSLTPSRSSEPSIHPTISSPPTIIGFHENFILDKIKIATNLTAIPSYLDFKEGNFSKTPQNDAAQWLMFMDEIDTHEVYYEDELLERFVLVSILFATNGIKGSNWMTNSSVCTWEGVTCEKEPPHSIVKLSMVKFEMKGTIPSEISLLSNLTDLFLDHNYLEDVDRSLYSLVKLRTLDLSSNQLQGTFPTEIKNLTNLSDLYLSYNDFTGKINDIDDSDFPELVTLHIHNNEISGTVPEFLCELRNKSLTTLWADCGGEKPGLGCSCCTQCYP